MCSVKCRVGDAGSCLAMAYATEKESKDERQAARLYRRACLLREANACTNYAAMIWVKEHSEEQLACARRTFEKACAAKEPFACGMVGRVMLESTKPPAYVEGRRYLETACKEVGGFSCRVLAMHLESGKLGEYRPELVRTLLTRACATGDPDACGEPKTASETFR
jgi:TPR repeat protein